MADTIDSLRIEIDSQATKANKSIDNLVKKLNTLSTAIKSIEKVNLTNFTQGINQFTNSMQKMQNVKAEQFSTIANGIKKISTIDSAKLNAVSVGLKNLSTGLNGFNNISYNFGNLSNLSNAINQLGYKASGKGTENLSKIKTDLIDFINGLNSVGSINFDMTGLSNLISSLNKLGGKAATQATANLKPMKEQILQFVSGLNGLGTINFNMSGLSSLVSSLSKLGGKTVTNAITNIPLLADKLKYLMQVLSTAPSVSQNVIQMTNALANLASQGNKVGTASNVFVGGLNCTSKAMKSSRLHALSLAAAFGKFYASYFLVIRGIKKLLNSIKSSMDYIETLNYFNQAFRQVADNADVSAWEEYGYKSAEAYANSFAERSKQLTQKLTGYEISNEGDLTRTSMPSLGLDPEKTMQYQATFAQMSSSMGVASETALKLSNALTMIGADLASVRNMNFTDVWDDMTSGLVGMSRTWDKYGVNIREVNLQQKLNDLGIQANISNLNQQDKAILRTIVLLDSTRYAWGDLANTINAPANQLRVLQANFQSLARTIGSLFLPVVSAVLPYINALVVALQRLFSWIAGLFGINLSSFVSSVGASAADMGIVADEADDTANGLDSAADSAEKLRKSLASYDELNVVPEKTDTSTGSIGGGGSGLGDMSALNAALDEILNEYQKEWDKAFADIQTNANKFADNVANAFKEGGLEGVGEYFSESLTNMLNNIDWNKVYSGARSFGTGLANFLNGLISPDLFSAVGKTVASALNTAIYAALSFGETFNFKNLGLSIASAINSFFTTFDFAALAKTINVWVTGILDTLIALVENTDWSLIGKKIGQFLVDIDFMGILSKVGKLIWEAIKAGIELWGAMFNAAPVETLLISAFAALSFLGVGKAILAGLSSAFLQSFSGASLTGLISANIITPLITSLGGALSGLATAITPFLLPIAAALAAVAVAGIGIHEALSPAISEIDVLSTEVDACGRQLSDTTISKISPFLDSLRSLDDAFAEIEFTGKIISDETVLDTQTKLSTITSSILNELDADKNEALANLNPLKNFTEGTDFAIIGQSIIQFYNDTEKTITDGEARINEIMSAASAEKRTLTEAEQQEISAIQETMKETGIKYMTESEEEQFLILNRLKQNATAISVEQASEIIKSSAETRDETIKNAEEQYNEILIQAENLKRAGAINDEQYQTMIDAAGKAKEETIKDAEEQYTNILTTAQDKLGETAKYIDENTGEIKSTWSVFWDDIGTELSSGATALKNDLKSAWDDVKTDASTKWDEIKTKVSGIAENISDSIGTNFSNALDKTKQIFGDIKDSIEDKINGAKDAVSAGIDKIKGILDFDWELPDLKLPHFKITGSFGLMPPTTPKVTVDWYAKGAVFDKPSLIGVGEAGKEAVMPLERNTGWIDNLADSISIKLSDRLMEWEATGEQPPVNVNVTIEGEMKKFIKAIKDENSSYQKQTGRSIFST